MKILAVAMLDWETFGSDRFFVQVSENSAMMYEANRKTGEVKALFSETAPLIAVDSAIERFGGLYRVEESVVIDGEAALVGYVGKFEFTEAGNLRLRAKD